MRCHLNFTQWKSVCHTPPWSISKIPPEVYTMETCDCLKTIIHSKINFPVSNVRSPSCPDMWRRIETVNQQTLVSILHGYLHFQTLCYEESWRSLSQNNLVAKFLLWFSNLSWSVVHKMAWKQASGQVVWPNTLITHYCILKRLYISL